MSFWISENLRTIFYEFVTIWTRETRIKGKRRVVGRALLGEILAHGGNYMGFLNNIDFPAAEMLMKNGEKRKETCNI